MIRLLFLFCLLINVHSWGQNDGNSKYHSPLAIPLSLSANFGELRPNHFHMGIDYKTNGRIGIPICSIEDGYVSRIKISSVGYGKVIYINHPNGITSVYAHCSSFIGRIDSIINSTQYSEQNYEIEIKPDSNLLPIKKGEIIALSGNTGNSSGPHLHFELRDTKSEIALNPLINGFEIYDTLPPTIKAVKIYSLTNEAYRWPGKSKIINVLKHQNTFSIPKNHVDLNADFCNLKGGIGFSIDAEDHINGYSHEFSYLGNLLLINNDTIFKSEKNAISFDASKFINTHEDIEEYKLSKRKFQKSFRNTTNSLEIYSKNKTGVYSINPKDSINVKYYVYDANQNKSCLEFTLKVKDGTINNKLFNITKSLIPESNYNFSDSLAMFEIKEGCVYEPIPINFQNNPYYSIGNQYYPIQIPIKVKLKLKNSELPIEKYYIKSVSQNKYLETIYQDGWLTAESKNLGSFKIDFDTIPPSIFPLNFKNIDTLLSRQTFTWKINEDKTKLIDYDLFIDDNWYLLEYESKGNYLTFKRPSDLIGKHIIRILVKDVCGNTNEWKKEIWFENQ